MTDSNPIPTTIIRRPRYSYEFSEKNEASKKAAQIVVAYLRSQSDTIDVKDVQDDPHYQTIDVDLILTKNEFGAELLVKIEIKADTWVSNNFWLETISNKALGTRGCFLKTEADYVYYFFVNMDCVYVIPMSEGKSWFQANMSRFETSETSSKDSLGNYQHTTVGKKVPIAVMCGEVHSIQKIEKFSTKIRARQH